MAGATTSAGRCQVVPQRSAAGSTVVGDHGQGEALVSVHARAVPEGDVHGVRQPVAQPVRPVVVVHGEQPAGRLEMSLRRLYRLHREQVALQPQRGLPGHQGQRVGQGEQDHVVLGVRLLQERPAVVDVHGDPGIPVRMIRVEPLAATGTAGGRSRPRRCAWPRARGRSPRHRRCRRRRSGRCRADWRERPGTAGSRPSAARALGSMFWCGMPLTLMAYRPGLLSCTEMR